MPSSRISSFDLSPGRRIGTRYVVETLLGSGSEGEVYQIRDIATGITRAAKLYFPHRDPRQRAIVRHARKLHILRHCPIVLQYHHSEMITVKRHHVVALISELYEGEQLERWIAHHPGGRLRPYRALCVLYYLARGLEAVHALGQYHADVHSQNILIKPIGVRFDMKLIDFYDWGAPKRDKQKQDIMDCIRILHELLGGHDRYAQQPAEIKHIIGGLKDSLVLKRFPTISALRKHLENFDWKSTL